MEFLKRFDKYEVDTAKIIKDFENITFRKLEELHTKSTNLQKLTYYNKREIEKF